MTTTQATILLIEVGIIALGTLLRMFGRGG
jgi:hypothetical protein